MAHDRYQYLPSVGFVLLFGIVVKYLRARARGATLALCAGILGVCVWLNVTQQSFYENEHSLLMRQFTVAGLPPDAIESALPKLAYYDCQRGQPEEARAELNLDPSAIQFFYRPSDGVAYITPRGATRAADAIDMTSCLDPRAYTEGN